MKSKILFVAVSLSILAVGCGASTPELSKEEQKDMDKLFREGIKPDNGAAPGATPSATTGGSKPMNQDAG